MQPAEANPMLPNPMLERRAPFWQRLRAWLTTALRSHAGFLERRTRDQLTPLRCWLTLIENVLRRLILLVASTTKVEVKAQWRPEPQAAPEMQPDTPVEAPADTSATPRSNTTNVRSHLYGINWPRKTQAGATATFTGAAPPTATATRSLLTIRIDIRAP